MRRRRPFRTCALLALLLAGGPALAQRRPEAPAPYAAAFNGPDPVPGLGVLIPVRITDARTEAPATQVRVSAVRLVSPFGAQAPVQPPSGPEVDGVRLFRADLPAPGAWTLEFSLAGPTGAPIPTSVGFTVAAPPAPSFPVEAQAPAAAAAEPSVAPLAPAATAPGPSEPDPSRTAGFPPR
ncbi:MAG: hypothetical protein INR64_07960 [Caulobacteraceae bacterium]|nr:hypothetical protein [Caulobacter sp.]